MTKTLIYLSLILLLNSCQKILFNEEEVTRAIEPGDFNAVDIRGVFDIVLIQDSADRIEITGKKDIGSVDAFVENGMLKVADPVIMSFNTKRNALTIHFTSIESLTVWNPVSISTVDTIKEDSFILAAISEVAEVNLAVNCRDLVVASANSLGHFNIRGEAKYFYTECWYGCSILADGLLCNDAEIKNSSAGDVYVSASGTITAYINGPGNIYYRGNPSIRIAEKNGSGKLIRID